MHLKGILLAFALSAAQLLIAQDYAEFKCTIKNPLRDWVIVEKVMKPFSYRDTVKLDGNNSFSYKTGELEELQNYIIHYGDRKMSGDKMPGSNGISVQIAYFIDKIDLTLNRGYKLEITVDAENRDKTLKISGKGHEMSNYYEKKDAAELGLQLKIPSLNRLPKKAFTDSIDKHQATLIKLMDNSLPQLKYLPKSFIHDEKKKLNYTTAIRKISFANAQIIRFKNDSILNEFDDKYFSFLKTIPFDNAVDKEDRDYTVLIRGYVTYMLTRKNKGERKSEVENFQSKFGIYKTLFKSDDLRDFQLFDLLYQNNSKAREKWYVDAVDDFKKLTGNDSLKYEIENIMLIRQKLAKGEPAYDFTMYDSTGKTHKLSDFKGSYVVIDAWATWCKPCILEIPHLQKLEKDMESKPIVFLSISIDENEAKWRGYLARKQMHGYQFWNGKRTNTDFKREFLIQGIPRFIVIDREGNIVDPNAPRPSSPELFNMLRGLDGLKFTRPQQQPASEGNQ